MKRFPGIELQGVDQRGRETREKIIAEQVFFGNGG